MVHYKSHDSITFPVFFVALGLCVMKKTVTFLQCRKIFAIGFLFFPFFFALEAWAGEKWVIAETESNAKTKIVGGNQKLAEMQFPPASTFKIFLAWVALEEKTIDHDTTIFCRDKHVPGCPRVLRLQEALFHSSNEFFVELGKKIGKSVIERYLSKYREEFPKNWLKNGAIYAGGELRISPIKQHEFMVKLVRGELCSSEKVRANLLDALSWPGTGTWRLFGKTGSASGVVWFNGFGVEGERWKVVTVFRQGPLSQRKTAIKQFYGRFGPECRIQNLEPAKR